MKCTHCKNETFEHKDGLFFCEECGVQHENVFLMEVNDEFTPGNLRKIYVADESTKQSNRAKYLKGKKLTSFEEYNIMLLGLVNEITKIQNIPNFKTTVLQLWISYLSQTEAAFLTNDFDGPKLQANYREEDAQILYNKKPKIRKRKRPTTQKLQKQKLENDKQKRKAMRKSEKEISKQLSESMKSDSMNSSSILANLSIETIIAEHENEEIDIEFSKVAERIKKKQNHADEGKISLTKFSMKEKITVLNSRILFFIICCALNICKSDIQLADLIRFTREGHLSMHSMIKFLPEEYLELGIHLSHNTRVHSFNLIDDKIIRHHLSCFVSFIPDLAESLEMPDLMTLIRRYVIEMNLPKDIERFAENLIAINPPRMLSRLSYPNYEGRAMAFIVFILKLLFGLDGYREIQMSDAAENIQKHVPKNSLKIFNFTKWKQFIEYRKIILEKFYYPSIFHDDYTGVEGHQTFNVMYDSISPDTIGYINSETKSTRKKSTQSKRSMQNLIDLAIDSQKNNKENRLKSELKKYSFEPSLTPLRDYFEQIIDNENDTEIRRDIAEYKCKDDSCEIYLRPQNLVNLVEDSGKELRVERTNFPPNFVIIYKRAKYLSLKTRDQRCFYECETVNKNFSKWKRSFSELRAAEVQQNKQKESDEQEKQKEKVLKRRKFWKDEIIKKKSTDKIELQESMFETDDDESEESMEECDHILRKKPFESKKKDCANLLKFYTPDFNMWRLRIYFYETEDDEKTDEMDLLPKSFRWLLNFAASVIHQHPLLLYNQISLIEFQYMIHLQPLELVENALLLQNEMKLPSLEMCYSSKFSDSW